MIQEVFSDGNSLIHHLDPRVKILIAFFFSLVVAVSSSWKLVGMSCIFSFFVVFFARLHLLKVLKRLLIVNGFILFLWILLPFTYPGSTLFSLGPLHATHEGIRYALLITIKSNSIILACIGLLSTSSIFSLVHAMSHLHVPDKLVQLFFFNYRYIHVLHQEFLKMKNTLKVRCFKPGTNIRTYHTYANLIAVLLLKSYDRAERVYNAMLCRGFKGRYHILDHFAITRSDVTIGLIMLLFIIGMIICAWMPQCL